MPTQIQNNFRVRKSFAKIQKIIDIPNLINIQKQSYEKFLQADIAAGQARGRRACRASSSRSSRSATSTRRRSLEFVSYHLEKPKYDVDECHQRGMTYSAPIKVVVRLVVWDKDEETGAQSIRDVKEQEVYFGEIPLMTQNGTFIINGTERVVVSQLHRTPGRVLRPRQGQEPLVRQAALQRPHHPVPRLVDRLRVRPQGPALRAHRPAPQAAGHGAHPRAGRGAGHREEEPARVPGLHRGDPQLLLRHRDHLPRAANASSRSRVELELLPGQRATRDIKTKSGEVIVKKNRKFTRAAIKKLERRR